MTAVKAGSSSGSTSSPLLSAKCKPDTGDAPPSVNACPICAPVRISRLTGSLSCAQFRLPILRRRAELTFDPMSPARAGRPDDLGERHHRLRPGNLRPRQTPAQAHMHSTAGDPPDLWHLQEHAECRPATFTRPARLSLWDIELERRTFLPGTGGGPCAAWWRGPTACSSLRSPPPRLRLSPPPSGEDFSPSPSAAEPVLAGDEAGPASPTGDAEADHAHKPGSAA